jgi:hypothetical protein
MTERNGSTSLGTGTAEIPVIRPNDLDPEPNVVAPIGEAPPPAPEPASHATAPVTVRPSPRMPRRGPLTVMGPWAPVAGGVLGLLAGLVVVLLLGGVAESFEDRLALTFTVIGLGLLGAAGVLLADEVRMMRQRARDAVVRPAYAEATAGLLDGLTPARLLLMVSGLVLFLAAFVSR